MTCKTIDMGPGAFAIVCSRGPKRPVLYCTFCLRKGHKARHTKLCGFRLAEGRTCDAPLCDACAVRRGLNLDYCPDHEALERSAMVTRLNTECPYCGCPADTRDFVDRHMTKHRAEIERLTKERDALREQTRIRDARVELPEDAETVLLRVEAGWRAVRYRAWGWSDGNDPADFPFWLPMPPNPEAEP